MKKTPIYNAIAICLSISATQVHARDVAVNNMAFNGNYAAEGTLRSTPGNFGFMQSVDPFFSNPWAAVGVAYFEPGLAPTFDTDLATDEANVSNGTNPAIFDDPAVNGAFTQIGTDNGPDGSGGTMYTWSGKADQLTAPAGAATFAYDFTLQPNEIAWGTIFNWNTNGGIPVLVIMDCVTTPGVCSGRGTPMVTAPFPTQAPAFSGGVPPLSCPDLSASIAVDGELVINKADMTSGCTGGQGVVNITATDITSMTGALGDNGTTYTYTPTSGFEGPESFGFTLADDLFIANATYAIQVGGELLGNFTIMKPDGGTFGGANDVVFDWDQTTFNTDESDNNFDIIKITSDTPFFDVLWFAHHIRVYDGGASGRTLTFDTTCTVVEMEAGTADCGGAAADMLELVIPPNMYGAHINFDWNGNTNIDVVNVWEPGGKWEDDDGVGGKNDIWQGPLGVPPHRDANWELASKDVNRDGINGAPMIDGPFPANYANFSWMPDRAGTKLPDITTEISDVEVDNFALSMGLWSMLAGLISVFGLRRFKNNK